jgi:hypothetical protein
MRSKYVLLLLSLIFFSFHALAQFPADKVYILLNTEVEVASKEKSQQQYGYDRFFVDEGLKIRYILKSGPTPYDSLVGKKFKVIDIIDFERYGERKYKLKLENPKIGVLYYDYDPTIKLIYPFIYTNERIDYCSQLTKTIDKFDDKTTIDTPLLNSISFTKVISNKVSKLYMSVAQNGTTLNVGKMGLTILFSNGKRLSKPIAKISVDAGSEGGWNYSSFISLLPTDLKLLSENIISDVKLYIYEGSIDNGLELKELLNCLIKAK